MVSSFYHQHLGGLEVVAGTLAREIGRRGSAVVWAASGPKPGDVWPGVEFLPMRAFNPLERWLGIPYPLWSPGALARLARAVRSADVVHLHDGMYFGSLVAALCALVFGRPLLVTQHIGIVPYKSALLRGAMALATACLTRPVLALAGQVVFVGARVRAAFADLRWRTTPDLIPNGVDHTLFTPAISLEAQRAERRRLGLPEDGDVLLFAGRFVEKKGLAVLEEVVGRFPEATWVFVGSGPLDPRRWRASNVICPGALPQESLAAYYRAADTLVLPSVGEGFPLVAQEALASGTPALLTPESAAGAPGVEAVTLTAAPDANAVEAALRSRPPRAKREASRRAAHAYAKETWSWDRAVAKYVAHYERLCGAAPGPSSRRAA
jgi:glycosyltransferase involved in cell wall biosynthesis